MYVQTAPSVGWLELAQKRKCNNHITCILNVQHAISDLVLGARSIDICLFIFARVSVVLFFNCFQIKESRWIGHIFLSTVAQVLANKL